MDSHADGAVGEILEIVVPDLAIHAHGLDQRSARHLQSVINKPVMMHICSAGGSFDADAVQVVSLEQAIPDLNVVRIFHVDAVGVKTGEPAGGQLNGRCLQTVQRNQVVPFAIP